MALQNDTSRIQYNGNNSTTSSYAIPFVFFENAHIKCVVTSSAGVDSTLALGSGFNVTGAANPNGGSLTTTAAVPTSSKVTIFREVPATQTTSYQEGGDFPAASHERALDKLTMIAQQTKRLADRALKVPESQSSNPPDLPNAGLGSKLLGSDNGSLSWKDERQLPSYPAGPTPKLLYAAGSGAAPTWQDAPTIAVGPVTSTGSGVPRLISDRFADITNVLDYGADPTGNTDSSLAIQRAIAAAANHPLHGQNVMSKNIPANTETTLTNAYILPDGSINPSGTPFTFEWGGKVIPQLFYVDSAAHVCYFPAGTYKISRPIVIGPGTQLIGENGARGSFIQWMPGMRGKANMIESYFTWLCRTQCDNNVAWTIGAGYDSSVRIENLILSNAHSGNLYSTPTTGYAPINRENRLAFYRLPFGASGFDTFNVKANATAGNNFFTPVGADYTYYPGAKLKLVGDNTVYTYVSRNNNQIFVTPNIATTVSNANVLIGLPANNGIMLQGGETARISRTSTNLFEGAGIFVIGGTPGPTITECMSNGNDIAYWLDAGVNILISPSGDGNNVFLRTGFISAGVSTTMISCKVEGKHSLGIAAGGPYPYDTDARSAIETMNKGPISNTFNFWGGTMNWHFTNGNWGEPLAKNHAFITSYRESFWPKFDIRGMRQGGFRETFLKQSSPWDPDGVVYGFDRILKRRFPYDYEDNVAINAMTHVDYSDDVDWTRATGVKINHRLSATPNTGLSDFSLYGDQGSGHLEGVQTWSRNGTTMTVQCFENNGTTPRNHNLQVGDQVKFQFPSGVTGVAYDNNPNNGNPYQAFFVKTASGNTFTVTVANSGGTGPASVRVVCLKIYQLHGMFGGEHVFQTLTQTGGSTFEIINGVLAAVALSVRDKAFRRLAGLRVGLETKGEWWASSSLNVGGTIATPYTTIETAETTLSGLSGATATASGFIPAGVIVYGVTARVLTAITGATTFDVGDGTDVDRWGAAIDKALNTTTTPASFTAAVANVYSANTNVVLTANGSNFTGGSVKLVLHFMRLSAPFN